MNRAIELGWPSERILVIDEDRGKSGTSAENRLGFQRLLAEVSLDHVGIILGLEMSRFERVEVAVEGIRNRFRVTITWAGGQRTEHELNRPVLRYEQTAEFDQLMARIRELRTQGHTFAAIADRLNSEGFRPHKGAGRFHKDIVSLILRRRTPGYQAPPKSDRSALGLNEWFVVDLAREVGIAKNTLHAWRQRGWVSFRRPIRCVPLVFAGPIRMNSTAFENWP